MEAHMDKLIHLLFGAILTILARWFGGQWGLLLAIPVVVIAAVLKEKLDMDAAKLPDSLDFVATFLGWAVVATLNFAVPDASKYLDRRQPQFYHLLILLFILGSLLAFFVYLDMAPHLRILPGS